MPSFALVHSPVLGPASWRWVAERLAGQGHRVTVPAVPGEITSLGWQAFADSVAAQMSADDRVILAGHSGAGPLLPQIQARARCPVEALVFVDAGIPPETGEGELVPGAFLADLRAMARDGLLPAWPDWFDPEVMAGLLPGPEQRAAVCGELPRLPVSFFERRVPVPAGWAATRCGYLQLSEPYAAQAADAARRGWPVLALPGTHLDIVTRPVQIADAILALTGQWAT